MRHADEVASRVDVEDLVDEEPAGTVGTVGDELGIERHGGALLSHRRRRRLSRRSRVNEAHLVERLPDDVGFLVVRRGSLLALRSPTDGGQFVWRLVAVAEAELARRCRTGRADRRPSLVLAARPTPSPRRARGPAASSRPSPASPGRVWVKNSSRPGAQVVLAGLAVARHRESVLRAAAVAQRPDLAAAALRGERAQLVVAELALLGRRDQLAACASRGCCPAGSAARRSGRTSRGRRCAPAPGRSRRSGHGCTAGGGRSTLRA